MKTMKCPICHLEREVEDNIIISICNVCQCEMNVKENNNQTLKEGNKLNFGGS